jgi:thioredoxin-dependent peroxiredoxin
VAFFAASVDIPEDNARFAKELELEYPILSDPGKAVAAAYGVVTPERQVAYRWTFYIGMDGKILAIDKAISTATAGKDVAAKLAALGIAAKK